MPSETTGTADRTAYFGYAEDGHRHRRIQSAEKALRIALTALRQITDRARDISIQEIAEDALAAIDALSGGGE